MAAYATVAELAGFMLGEVPEDAERQLDRASELIDDFTVTARYAVDVNGLPTEADDIAAFRDAACAQVEFWTAGDEEDDVLGPLKELKIGTVDAVPAYVMVLAPRAGRILRDAGLYNGQPVQL